jgi:hypothetical protein
MGPIMNMNKLKIGKNNPFITAAAIALFISAASVPLLRRAWEKMTFINPEMFE